MEDKSKETYLKKENLEKEEIPPDTEVKNPSQDNSSREELNPANEQKEINKENEEVKDEPNEEELEELADDIHHEIIQEKYGEEENDQEIEDNQEEQVEENDGEEVRDNKESYEDEPEQNEEMEDNYEENQENYEEEDSEQKQPVEKSSQEQDKEQLEYKEQLEQELQENELPEEQELIGQKEQQEYKERQGIHIHKGSEEKEQKENLDKEHNIEETGKINPMDENNANKEEGRIEYKVLITSDEDRNEEVEKNNEHEVVENDNENYTHEIQDSQPMDNKPKEDIQEPQKINQNMEIKTTGEREEIPRVLVFQKPKQEIKTEIKTETKIEKEFKLKRKDYKNFVEIPKEEREKYSNIETIVLKGGMETGEYKFQGGAELTIEEPAVGKISLEKEEIMNEINLRKKKEKKISYELVDQYYSLTVFEENEKHIEINLTNKEQIENNNELNSTIPNDNYSKYLLEQINKIRADPQSFIGVIEDAKDNIKKSRKGKYYYNGNKIKVALKEGEQAFNEAIEFLKSCQPMNPLTFSQELIPPNPKNEDEIEDRDYLKNCIDKMMYSGIRINSYWRDFIKDAEICFLLMIVDDNGNKKGMRRNDILNPSIKKVGISSVEINGYFINYFILSQ